MVYIGPWAWAHTDVPPTLTRSPMLYVNSWGLKFTNVGSKLINLGLKFSNLGLNSINLGLMLSNVSPNLINYGPEINYTT